VLAVDVSALAFAIFGGGHGDDSVWIGFVVIAAGLGLMAAAYRAFRYGEQYEYRQAKESTDSKEDGDSSPLEEAKKWLEQL
jgi:hypothetical protein